MTMPVTLRMENSDWPLFRVLYATTFAADGSGPWTEAPYLEPGINGVWFQECERQVLPGIGTATLLMEFGTIDGEDVTPLDLLDKHIRIQAARRPINGSFTPAWKTIWLGRVEWQDDKISPAATILRGTRIYHCVDLLYAYLRGYPMDRHATYDIPTRLAYGHPGYNYTKEAPSVAVGNRESTGGSYGGPDSTSVLFFGVADAANGKEVTTWTDAQALENTMLLRRNEGDPIFDLDYNPAGADTTILDGATPWPVRETDTAWDIVNRICDRRRGKGLAYLGWADDSATPTGAIDVKLYVRPQLAASITYTYPAGTDVTIPGADSTESTFAKLNFAGDHRVVEDAFQIRDTTDSAIDEMTTEGEQIQVAVTVNKGTDATLVARYDAATATARDAASDDAKKEERFHGVRQAFGLSRSAGVSYKNGDGASSARIDYWTDASGYLTTTHDTVTAAYMVKIMDDLPLYEGFDYTVQPPIPLDSASWDGTYRRRKPQVYVRTGTNRFVYENDVVSGGAQVDVTEDGIMVQWVGSKDGIRMGDGTADGLLADYSDTALTLTIGVQLPQRVRFVSTATGTVRRRKTIRVPDCHLWIAHAGTIHDLDQTTADDDNACNAKRIGGTMSSVGGSVAGTILRDDRADLARVHYLAWEWYRSDANRKSLQWAWRDCALIGTWQDISGTTRYYPSIGQIIISMQAGGEDYTPNTPVTRIVYDNRSGTTTYTTDWSEFDYGSA